jgi:polyphosphate kinase
MYRNLEQRVEAVCPALDRGVRQRLLRIFQVMEADRRHAWALRSDGRYVLKTPEEFGASELGDLGTFEVLMRDALASA